MRYAELFETRNVEASRSIGRLETEPDCWHPMVEWRDRHGDLGDRCEVRQCLAGQHRRVVLLEFEGNGDRQRRGRGQSIDQVGQARGADEAQRASAVVHAHRAEQAGQAEDVIAVQVGTTHRVDRVGRDPGGKQAMLGCFAAVDQHPHPWSVRVRNLQQAGRGVSVPGWSAGSRAEGQ